MKTMHKIKTATLLVAAASFVLSGCHKDKLEQMAPNPASPSAANQRDVPPPVGNASLTLKLTNTSPRANYGAVNIEIIGAVVHYSDKKLGITGYATLNLKPRIYNLMDLINNQVTIATDASLPAAKIDQVRLVFGIHNSVVIASMVSRLEFPLHVHDPIANYANVATNTSLVNGQDMTVLLDFDAIRSVNAEGEMEGHVVTKPATDGSVQSNIRRVFFLEPQIHELSTIK
jgi:hypothetical protein